MNKNYRPLLVFSSIISCLIADPADHYWQQNVDYDMEITLHDSIRQLAGKTIIRYTNNSPDSLDRIYMHLYPNAFQVGSVKYREYISYSGRISRAKYFKERRTTSHWPCPITVNSLQPNTWGDDSKKIDYEKIPVQDLSDLAEDIVKLIV